MKPKRPSYKFLRFQRAISPKRLEAYRSSSSDKELDLLSTYLWNIGLCEAFYPVLHSFEIALRNNLHQAISRLFYEDWLDKIDSQILQPEGIQSVKTAIKSLNKKNQSISTGNLISELNLGFWVSLSYARYEGKDKLYPRLFKDKEFLPHLPKSRRTRSTLSRTFTSINQLRNQIFHHNPVWNKSNLREEYDNALEAIQWISPILYETTKHLSRFPDVYAQGRAFYVKILEAIMTNYERN
ncbi:Abi family protein [Halotia branconii]|uniref:Abi family protein n=1 Tax=Halotia branconii CENA392 TaxID=1539056 RepID=A0AAJ6NXC6_9CYAN|nr:Abi family protein [Halotia branconii]WGV28208.1 Abi family protein [Halotia branconii CENA392]